ncbi:MAG: helix-turn-helix transcriptional regulator [Verrucomicrobia bacterium]|nr:helix-turn-helix transcriptional regulator [Verrucomicrobiota bacterium]
MRTKWIYNRPVEDVRSPASFAPYPDPLPDPDGNLARWLDLVQITPISTKEWRCRPGWFLRPRVGGDSFWFCYPDGWGTAIIGGDRRTIRFGAGDLVLIRKGAPHSLQLKPGIRARFYAVHFHATLFGGMDLLDLMGFPWHVPATRSTPFVNASAELAQIYARQAPGWSRAMTAVIFNLLFYLLTHHGRLFTPQQPGLPPQRLLRMMPVLELIEQRLADSRLGVPDMARSISVSEVHLRKLFRAVTGVSPVVFLQRRRMAQAGILLRTSNLGIKEVAQQCGFAGLPFFYTVFKRWNRQTPVAYREAQDV